MFRDFLNLWKDKDTTTETLTMAVQTLKIDREMFIESVKSLREDNDVDLQHTIYDKDEEVNKSERSIRKKVLMHLLVSGKSAINEGLILSSLVIDIERIGDYTKNIADLAELHPKKMTCGKFKEPISQIEEQIKNYFDFTIDGFENSNKDAARKVTNSYKKMSFQCSEMKKELIGGEVNLSVGDAVSLALYLRFLKRVAAHLYNICTSVVNPFHRIGYKEKRK